MKYHILASKEIKPCKENSCRAKHGSFATKKEAEAARRALISKETNEGTKKKKTAPKTRKTTLKKVDANTTSASANLQEELNEIVLENTEKSLEVNGSQDKEIHAEGDTSEYSYENTKINEYEERYESDSEEELWDDDEEFLRGDDEILDERQDSALFKQAEGVIRWNLENFFNEEGKRRGKYSLRQSPPILKIEDSSNTSVEIVLSREVAHSLNKTMDMVYRGYFGVGPKKDPSRPQPNKAAEVATWFEENPIKGLTLVIGVLLLLVMAFAI